MWIEKVYPYMQVTIRIKLTPNHTGVTITLNQPFTLQKAANGAGNETRTRDTKLGKLVLYQLSYARPLDLFNYDKKNGLSIIFVNKFR